MARGEERAAAVVGVHGRQPLAGPVANVNGQQETTVGPGAGRFRAVRLDVMQGRLFIGKVLVEFMDDSKQIVLVNRWVGRENPQIYVDLNGDDVGRSIVRWAVGGTAQVAGSLTAALVFLGRHELELHDQSDRRR